VGRRSLGTLPAAVALAVLLAGGAAPAWPADVYLDLTVGNVAFKRLAAVSFVEVEDASIAEAEVMPSGELMLTGKAEGRTLLLLYAEGKFAVWRLRVAKAGERPSVRHADEASRAAVAVKCPGAKPGQQLIATVKDEACRTALRTLLESDTWSARDLELTFELGALQAQLADIEAGLRKEGLGKLEARYVGAGVVMTGEVSAEEHRRALWVLFQRSVGRVPLEDRVQVKEAQAPQDR
jgi:hypothetical protein